MKCQQFFAVSLVVLALMLACVAPPWMSAVAPSPTVTAVPTVLPTVTKTPKPAFAVSPWKATISKVLVNVRDEPDGDIVTQLRSGESVTILKCAGEWCKISKPVSGWIFKGCLDIASGLGCEAKK